MATVSTRSLELLPGPADLERIMRALAVLDAVMSPEWEYRCYSYDAHWGDRERMGSFRNGAGDDLFAWFADAGCFIKGFDHECAMSPFRSRDAGTWAGVVDSVPRDFDRARREPAFAPDDVTFCLWRRAGDDRWRRGEIAFPDSPDPDGSVYLLHLLGGAPERYRQYAAEYHEVDVPIEAVRHVYAHRPLNDEVVRSLNREVEPGEVSTEIAAMGYPVDGMPDGVVGTASPARSQ